MQHLTLKKIIELNASSTNQLATFCPPLNWQNNLNSATLQYCRCDFFRGYWVITKTKVTRCNLSD